MHGIAKILDRHADELHCRLALIEDGCYKIYQPKIASHAIQQISMSIPTLRSNGPRCVLVPIFDRNFDAGTVVYWALQILAAGFQNDSDKWSGYDQFQPAALL